MQNIPIFYLFTFLSAGTILDFFFFFIFFFSAEYTYFFGFAQAISLPRVIALFAFGFSLFCVRVSLR